MKKRIKKVVTLGLTIALISPTLWAYDYSNHWAEKAIETFKGYNIIKGYEDGSFKPNNTVTRAEFSAILARLFNLTSIQGAPTYIDLLGNNKWYTTVINQVNAAHLMHIEGSTFHPHQLVTREEAAYALAKAYQISSEAKEPTTTAFIDDAQIAPWSKMAIQSLLELNYIEGTPDGRFNPKGTLTRAELITMLNNLTGHILLTPGTYSKPLKGNIIINNPDVLLKNTIIDGNLYLTQGLLDQEVILDQVTVTGNVYINGGIVTMNGDFNKVILNSGQALTLKKGHMELLQVTKAGSTIKIEDEAKLTTLNPTATYLLIGNNPIKKPITGGTPSPNGGTTSPNNKEDITVTDVYIWLNNKPIALPVEDNTVILDIPSLSHQHSASSTLNGLSFNANLLDTTISSDWGELTSDTTYSFRRAEDSLGMLREIALRTGIGPDLVIDYIFGGEELTLGSLLEDYELAQDLSSSLNLYLENNYQLTRTLHHPDGNTTQFVIDLHLK